jgi:allantoin racemase
MRVASLAVVLAPRPYLDALIPAGVELVTYPPRIPLFPHTPYERLLIEVAHVDAAERAAADGVDAIVIDSTCDWGIEAIRAAVDIPVVGAGEIGISAASAGGRRYSIVTVWPPSLRFLYEERLRSVPGGETCAGIRYVSEDRELDRLDADDNLVARLDRGEETILDRLVAECRRSVVEDGAEAVLLGCTCMAGIAPAIEERFSEVPVIESSRLALRAVLDATVQPARRTRRTGLASQLLDAWLEGAPAQEPLAAEECEVCAPVEHEHEPGLAGASAT